MRINIAIDGPSAAGKSTIANRLAEQLGYIHLDTGAMYRCTALKCVKEGIAFDDEDAVCDMLKDTDMRMTSDGKSFLDGEDVSQEIRTDEISLGASDVSKLKRVREDLVARQQELAKEKGYILDGRDIGTVVLPDAEVKIYLTASAQARAERRYKQNIEKGIETSDIETIRKEIEQRDYQDMHRENSPLRPAEDSITVDTSDMDIEEVVETVMNICQPFLDKEEE